MVLVGLVAQMEQSLAPKAMIQYLVRLLQLGEDLAPIRMAEMYLAVLAVLAEAEVIAAQQVLVTRQAHLPPKAQTVAVAAAAVLIMALAAAAARRLLV